MGILLDYLDREIELFRQKNNDYPNLILMNKETKDKIFAELDLTGIKNNNSWYDIKDNYRGIKIKIKEDTFIKLE
jgi:preprotein translocase subunit Sec63